MWHFFIKSIDLARKKQSSLSCSQAISQICNLWIVLVQLLLYEAGNDVLYSLLRVFSVPFAMINKVFLSWDGWVLRDWGGKAGYKSRWKSSLLPCNWGDSLWFSLHEKCLFITFQEWMKISKSYTCFSISVRWFWIAANALWQVILW